MPNNSEEFRKIKNLKYSISSEAKVKNDKTGRILKPHQNMILVAQNKRLTHKGWGCEYA